MNVTENQSNLETKICRCCHEEKIVDNFPLIESSRSKRNTDVCKQCHENSKNGIFSALYEILSTSSQDLKERIDYSSLKQSPVGLGFKVTIEENRFIEKIQFIAKSIAHHYYFQITLGGHFDDKIADESEPSIADWKDEFLYTLEVYQRLYFVVRNHLSMAPHLRYLIQELLPRIERRITPESEPSRTHPWISLDSLWVAFGHEPIEGYKWADMIVCSHCCQDLVDEWRQTRNTDGTPARDYPYFNPGNDERVRVFRQKGRFSHDFTFCDCCGGSCHYCDKETIVEFVGKGDWEGDHQLCTECDERDLDDVDWGFDAQKLEEDFEQATPNELLIADKECSCGGSISRINDMTVPEQILRCEDCELEYKFCSTCSNHYLASSGSCPNDHFFD